MSKLTDDLRKIEDVLVNELNFQLSWSWTNEETRQLTRDFYLGESDYYLIVEANIGYQSFIAKGSIRGNRTDDRWVCSLGNPDPLIEAIREKFTGVLTAVRSDATVYTWDCPECGTANHTDVTLGIETCQNCGRKFYVYDHKEWA